MFVNSMNLIIKINLVLRTDNIYDKNENYLSEKEMQYENENQNENDCNKRARVVMNLCNEDILDAQ